MKTKLVDCWICSGNGIVGMNAEVCPACLGTKTVTATCHGETGMTVGEIDREIAHTELMIDEAGDTFEIAVGERRIERLHLMRELGVCEEQAKSMLAHD